DGSTAYLTGHVATRALREQAHSIAHAAIAALAAEGKMTAKDVARAIKLYKIDSDKPNPLLA
ncbi:MAG TPA: hypothetical protein VHF02_06120, partial [Luteimonas sp.]|nr:hypothetical protein [Luteimonas sp.]